MTKARLPSIRAVCGCGQLVADRPTGTQFRGQISAYDGRPNERTKEQRRRPRVRRSYISVLVGAVAKMAEGVGRPADRATRDANPLFHT